MQKAVWYDCARNNYVVRTHSIEAAMQSVALLRQRQLEYNGGKKKGLAEKCSAITSVRDPRSWLPSLYFEKHKQQLCQGDLSVDRTVADFKAWCTTSGRLSKGYILPHVLQMFGADDVSTVLSKVTKSGGAITFGADSLNPPGGSKKDPSPLAGCHLLFLRTEMGEDWASMLEDAIPGVHYKRTAATTSHCPGASAHCKWFNGNRLQ